MRLSSGVPGFDALIQGGIPSGAAVVIQGPAGREKDTFLFQFIVAGLRGGGSALVVLSSVSPAKYMEELREAGVDVDRAVAENRLKFVDWFTYKENPVQDVEQDGPVFRASIDLANVGIAISRAIAALSREGERRAAVEVLSPALSAYDLSGVYGFAQSTKAKLERSGFTSLFVLEEEMHDERTLSSIHQPFDGVVDIERVREGDEIVRKVAVLSLRGTAAKSKYVPLEVGSDRELRVSTDPMRERTRLLQEELIKENPKDPKLWLATARNLRVMGENARALRCVEAALNLAPDDHEAWRFKAEILDSLGRKDEADHARARGMPPPPPPAAPPIPQDATTRVMDLVEQRLRNDPRDADALFAVAAVLARANDLIGAVAILDKLAEIDETYPGLWVLKTQLHARRGELKKAEESRTRRLEIEQRQDRETPKATPIPTARLPPVRAPAVRPPTQLLYFCPSCGSAVREEDTICSSCGVIFEGSEVPPSPPPRVRSPAIATPTPAVTKPKPEIPTIPPPTPKRLPEPRREVVPWSRVEPRVAREPPATRGRTNGLAKGSARVPGRTNGLVNGTRGRTNGLVNGLRGRTNGLVNGLRGRTNGLVNGARPSRGRTNGLVNGLRGRTNGLVNGLQNMRSGMTNGLTNGTGLTNGLGADRLAGETGMAKWKVYVIPIVTIALLLLPILGPESLSGSSGISIDGDASDWDPARIAIHGRSSGATNPNVDIVRTGIDASASSLFILVQVEGTMLTGGGTTATTDRFHVFLDTDRDIATGYTVDSLGADTLIDVSGHGGIAQEASIYTWDGALGSHDWRGWERSGFAAAGSSGSTLEIRMDWSGMVSDSSTVVAAVHGRAFDETFDTSDSVLSAGGSLGIVQEPVVADVLPGPTAAVLLRFDVTAYGGPATLTGLDVTLTGLANVTSVATVRLVDGGSGLVDQRIPTGPDVAFQFAARNVIPSSPQRFFVVADILPSDGSTLGAIIADASDVRSSVPASVRRAPSAREVGYLTLVPPEPRVDGGYSEWTGILPDPQGDAGRGEVDLTAFDARFAGNTSYFYAAVDGRILSGTWVPEGNRAVYLPPVNPGPDSDRDTVPDAADLYPFDFDNDLVPDADSGGDVDADGLVDYGQPGGSDWWLNTTIPASFPAPYAGKPVSTFIGPWEMPFRTRDDIVRLLVDLDNSSWTGFSIAGLGADRLIEISGTEGRLRNADYFTFGGSYPGQWSWIPLSPATVATGFSRMEFSVAANLSASGARMFVEARAPLGANDDMDGTRGAGGSGWSNPSPSAAFASSFDRAPSPIVETWRATAAPATRGTLIDASSSRISTQYNHQRKVVRAGDVAGDGACDATNSDGCWYAAFSDQVRPIESDAKDGTSVAVPTTIGLLDSLATTRPSGDNLIVAAIQFDNTNAAARTISAGNLEIRRGTATTDPFVSENQFAIVISATGVIADGMFAVLLGRDASAPASSTYGVFGAASGTGLNAEVKFLILNGLASSDSEFTDGGSQSFGSATVLATETTSFPASSSSLPNIIVAAVQIDRGSQDMQVAAAGLELNRGTLCTSTTIASNEYAFGMDDPTTFNGISVVLVTIDTAGAANQAYSVCGTVSSGGPSNGEAKILAFRGLSANAVDSGSVSIGTSRTVIGTATTSFATGDDIVIGAIQLSALTSTRTIAAAADDIRRNGEGSGSSNQFAQVVASATFGGGQFQTFVRKVTTTTSSPSYEGAATAPASSSLNAELKLVAIHLNAYDRIVLMRSSDTSGSTWGSQIILASGNSADSPLLYTYDSAEPSIAIDASGFLHVVWVSASGMGEQSTLDRVRYTKTTVAYPTQSELAAAGNWEAVTSVDDSYGAKVGAFNIGTGSVGTTVPVTVGFQPKVVLFWWSGRTTSTDSAGTATHQRGFGVAVTTTDRRAICSVSPDNVGTSDTETGHRADAAICSLTTPGVIDGLADLSSMDANGFTLIIDDAFATDLRIHYLALGGTSLTNAATGMFTESATTGNQDITTVGFQPDAVILLSSMIDADPPGTNTDSRMMVGLAAGAGNPNDVVWAGDADSSQTTMQTISYHRAGESIALFSVGATSTTGRGEVDAWRADGFSLNWNEATADGRRIHYLALKGGSYLVGDLLTLATTGTIAESGFGFSPKASLFLSHNKAQSTADLAQDHDELSVGAFSSTTDRGAQCVIDEDAVAPSDVGTAVEHDEVYCNLSTATAIEGLMGIQSVDSGGFTLVMDDPDPVASFVGYIAFGADITYPGYMPTVSTDTSNNPHVAWSGSKTSGTVYYRNKAGGTWRSTVSWGTTYTGLSVDVSPQNNYASLARYYEAGTNEIQYTVCKDLSTSNCDASAEFTKWDGTAGVDTVATAVETASYPSLATTYEANGDLWVAYADNGGTTRTIYARNLDYPSGGWQAATTVDSLSGTIFTRPSIGIDKDNNVHALYVSTSGPQLYYNKRTGGSWGTRSAVDTTSDNPTLMVRTPNDVTYGGDTGGLYWKTATSETYFHYIPEFEAVAVPILGILLFVLWRRRRARRTRSGDGGPDVPLLSVTR